MVVVSVGGADILFMAFFGIENLFTMFLSSPEPTTEILSSKQLFETLPELADLNSLFVFDSKYFQ